MTKKEWNEWCERNRAICSRCEKSGVCPELASGTGNVPILDFSGDTHFDGDMDKQCIDICRILNCLPGIMTTESCSGHGKDEFMVFFRAYKSWPGLAFLGRCLDRRYGGPEHLVVELDNNDVNVDWAVFLLRSRGIKGRKAYNEVKKLCKNMREHINHINYRRAFTKDLDGFNVRKKKGV